MIFARLLVAKVDFLRILKMFKTTALANHRMKESKSSCLSDPFQIPSDGLAQLSRRSKKLQLV